MLHHCSAIQQVTTLALAPINSSAAAALIQQRSFSDISALN
jgi:hypothetical protein